MKTNYAMGWLILSFSGLVVGLVGAVNAKEQKIPLGILGWMFLGIAFWSIFNLLAMAYLSVVEDASK